MVLGDLCFLRLQPFWKDQRGSLAKSGFVMDLFLIVSAPAGLLIMSKNAEGIQGRNLTWILDTVKITAFEKAH